MRFSEPNPTIRQRRSYVDLPSNAGIIGPLLTTRDLGKFWSGNLDRKSLPAVIHEATHHWCFQGPVGVALSILYLRAMATIVEFGAGRGAAPVRIQEAIGDYLRYERAVQILEPLIEGLALFAEFDVTGTSKEVWPLPLVWAVVLFGGRTPAPPSVEEFMAKGHSLVAAMQESEEMVARKTDVLLGTLKASANPYLAGYLTTKWAWHITANHRPVLLNRDVFFAFLRNYLFCDLELVRLLLEASVEEFDQKFALRIQTRMGHLLHDPGGLPLKPDAELLNLLDRYEWSPDTPPDLGLVGLSVSERDRGQQAILSSIRELEHRANDGKGNRSLWSMVVEMLNERDAFVLDRCGVDIDITADGIARVNLNRATGLFFVAGPCENRRLWGKKGTGYATMLLSRRAGLPYFAVCYDREVLFEFTQAADTSSSEKQRMRDLALGVGRTASVMAAWHAYVDQWMLKVQTSAGKSPTGGRSWFSSSFFNVREVVDRLYGRLSMPPFLTEQESEDALTRLEANGIARMFPPNRIRLLPVMVGWSLGGAQKKHIDAMFSKIGPNESVVDIIMDVNAEAKSCWGAELFVLEAGEIRSLTL